MKVDEEIEMLLGEIPHAVSLNLGNVHHHHKHGNGGNGGGDHNRDVTQKSNAIMYGDDTVSHNNNNNNHPTCASPESGFSLHSGGSSSNLFSGGYSFSDHGSPTTPPAEETKPYSLSGTGNHPNRLQMEFNTPHYSVQKRAAAAENVADEINLSRNLGRLYISDETKDAQLGRNGRQIFDHSINEINEALRLRDNYNGGTTGNGIVGLQHQYPRSNLLGSPFSSYSASQADDRFPRFNTGNVAVNSQSGHRYHMAVPENDAFGRGANNAQSTHVISPPPTIEDLLRYQSMAAAYNIFPLPVRMPYRGYGFSRGNINNKGSSYEVGVNAHQGKRSLFDSRTQIAANQESTPRSQPTSPEVGVNAHQGKRSLFDSRTQIAANQESTPRSQPTSPVSLPSKYDSLAEAQGYIYHIAKDQHGCRFLQKMFDEGTPQDVRIIFGEIIDHVAELMMNPFGNYLMQKLVDVCNEEQRMEILLRVTAIRGQLIKISLNSHGTRVVQKLIEKLKSSQQTSLVISALEPGFLALIKDTNGNHVIQRCLSCLSKEDNKFIFVAAAKYCVDIATHQNGCCVLQRCIEKSTGEHRENLIAEVSANGLLLTQDPFGNYVVQYVLEHIMPSETSKLLSQFDGYYVHLSTQKFSSHVVEKCLLVCNKEVQSKIIHELLSTPHFEQLLQHPNANYVVQTALKVSEGRLRNLLVDAIESYKAISRNSPYSKRIFSHKLLRK